MLEPPDAVGKELTMNPHVSDHPIGTVLRLVWKGKPWIARLVRRIPNGEEWRIEKTPGVNYVFSESYRWVSEHRIPEEVTK
jgi:hypothetical protein